MVVADWWLVVVGGGWWWLVVVGGGWWLLVVGIWWKAEVVLVAMHASGSEGMAGVVVVVAETPSSARVVIVGAA